MASEPQQQELLEEGAAGRSEDGASAGTHMIALTLMCGS
jgi:hypothetical protein